MPKETETPPTDDPVKTRQLDWIKQLTGAIADSDKTLAEADERANAQALVERGLGPEARDKIKADLQSVTITVKGKLRDKQMSILDKDGNTDNEIDTWHHGPKMAEALSPEDNKKLTEALNQILAVQDQLRAMPLYNPGDPPVVDIPSQNPDEYPEPQRTELRKALIDAVALRKTKEAEYAKRKAECEARLAEDLWLPLQREGVIPENLVPQEMSSVANQFKAAGDLYDERLQEYSATLTEKDLLKEDFALAFKIGKSMLKLASAGAGLGGAIGTATGADKVELDAEQAAEIIGYCETAMGVVEGVTDFALSDRDFGSLGDVVAGAVSDIVSAAAGDDVGAMVGTAITVAARGARCGQLLKKGDYKGAALQMAQAIAAGCAGFDKTDGKVLTEIGAQFEVGVNAFLAGWNMAEAIDRGASPQDIMRVLMTNFENIASAAANTRAGLLAKEFAASVNEKTKALDKTATEKVSAALGKKKDKEEDEEEDEGGDDEEEGEGIAEQALALSEQRALIGKKFDADALQKMREDAAAKQAEDMEALRTEEAEKFREMLISGLAPAIDDDEEIAIQETRRLQSIDYILAVQKKNDATFALCKSIAEKGMGLVVKLFPGAGLIEACMTLSFTIQDAIVKTQEMVIWMDNFRDAQAASSAQVDAFMNRKGLQTKQAAMANIQVALDAAKVVAQVMKLTPIAGAAPVVEATISTTEAAIELTDTIYTEIQLARAWKIYQRARDVPQDRYLARKATQENPTLSKYAMAWGAKNGDPIAVEGMRRCGLNDKTLAQPETNVAKVVAYLEAKYADDPVLLRAVPVKEKWHPGPIELTLKSWAGFYRMATTEAVPAVAKTVDISAINAALGTLDGAEKAFAAAVKQLYDANGKRSRAEVEKDPGEPDAGQVAALLGTLYRLRDALARYKAVDTTGKPHAEMAAYVDALAARAEQRATAVDTILAEKGWSLAYKRDAA